VLRWALLLTVCALWMGACDHAANPPATKPVVAAGVGIIRGTVHYQGPPVTPKVIGTACCPGASPATDETVMIDPAGGLANVVVWIENGPNIPPVTMKDAVLKQQDCRYVPHVLAVQTGRRIQVTSHDATMHNVHYTGEENPEGNFAETLNQNVPVTFTVPDTVHFKCDVHPWMSAYVKTFDHPCFAVTGPDGSFTIDRLPPGTYKICAWQEKFGQLETTVTVNDATPVTADFTYKP
jgi:plastocyanin